jgi:acyl dehydratase
MDSPVEYRVRAYNTAVASENRMHDGAVARDFGFRGGLVPGVDVYAYMTHPIVARWGRDWLERGAAAVRFSKPVYDGEEVRVCTAAAADGLLAIEVCNAAGEVCATARAVLPEAAPPAPELAAYPAAPLPAELPAASPQTLVPGGVLGSYASGFRAERAPEYLADVRETLPLYRSAGIAHPGYLLRSANYILAANVRVGPWIHAGSEVQNFALARDGDRITTRGRVLSTYEKRGHRFVELDLLLVANDDRPLLQVHHVAIYQPRRRGA